MWLFLKGQKSLIAFIAKLLLFFTWQQQKHDVGWCFLWTNWKAYLINPVLPLLFPTYLCVSFTCISLSTTTSPVVFNISKSHSGRFYVALFAVLSLLSWMFWVMILVSPCQAQWRSCTAWTPGDRSCWRPGSRELSVATREAALGAPAEGLR